MKSLRLRATLGGLVWAALALALAGWAIMGLFAAASARQFDARLEAHLSELTSAIAVTDRSQTALEGRMADPRFHRPLSGFYWQVDGPAGASRRSRSLWDVDLALPKDDPPDGGLHRHHIAGPGGSSLRALERVIRTPSGEAWRIAVAADQAELDAERGRFSRALLASLAALGAALGAAAAAQAALILRPLARLRDALAAYRAGASPRVAGDFPSEIAPLAGDLNGVLDQNEKLVAQARRRAADLAHALKTPAAALRNELDGLEAEIGAARLKVAREALDRIDAQTRRQLARARIALGGPGARAEIAPAAARLIRTLARIYADRALTFSADIAPGAAFRGDAEDLEEMLGNLMDNACKWANGAVAVSAAVQDGALVIVIDDDGPGVPDAARAHVLSAGVRLDEGREGSGLGLAIVVDIVEAYGGGFTLDRSASGGLRAILRFESPAAA